MCVHNNFCEQRRSEALERVTQLVGGLQRSGSRRQPPFGFGRLKPQRRAGPSDQVRSGCSFYCLRHTGEEEECTGGARGRAAVADAANNSTAKSATCDNNTTYVCSMHDMFIPYLRTISCRLCSQSRSHTQTPTCTESDRRDVSPEVAPARWSGVGDDPSARAIHLHKRSRKSDFCNGDSKYSWKM